MSDKKSSEMKWLLKKFKKIDKFPLVSVLTPTYNRRDFIDYSRKCLESQDYPIQRIEWIVLDDGTDKIEDLVSHLPQVKYRYESDKMNIGKKRNIVNQMATGDFMVAWDDDDYYPPTRITHSIQTLLKQKVDIVGASECQMWQSDIKKIYKVGPYNKTHGTNGTMAYSKTQKERHIQDEYVINAEESSFTGGFKEKMAQLDPFQCILVTSHSQNTFDKRGLRGGNKLIQPTEQKIEDWIKNEDLKYFYENCWELLQKSKQLTDV